MRRTYVYFATLLLSVIVCVGCGGNQAPTESAIRTAWISGFESCPSHSEYGQLVVDAANLYSGQEMPIPPIAHIPHGAQIEILEEATAGMYRVRYNGQEGYVQDILVVDYDPSEGVRPDEDYCY